MDQRIKGQEVSIRVIQGGAVVATIDSVAAFNEEVALELKEQGYLGEPVNRFDEILNGFGGDFDFHVSKGSWLVLQQSIIDRATRRTPNVTYNVVRTDFFPNGDTAVYSYTNVFWGAQPTNIGSRGDYVKVHASFKCSERPVQLNALP